LSFFIVNFYNVYIRTIVGIQSFVCRTVVRRTSCVVGASCVMRRASCVVRRASCVCTSSCDRVYPYCAFRVIIYRIFPPPDEKASVIFHLSHPKKCRYTEKKHCVRWIFTDAFSKKSFFPVRKANFLRDENKKNLTVNFTLSSDNVHFRTVLLISKTSYQYNWLFGKFTFATL
jgi:hypothetical protein